MESIVVGLRPADFILGASDFLLAVAHSSIRTCNSADNSGNLQNREYLPGANPIADIDVDVAYVARDLCMEFHFLVRQKLACNRERVGQWCMPNLYYRCARDCVGGHSCRGTARTSAPGRGKQYDHHSRNCCSDEN